MKLICVDPGKISGLALIDFSTGTPNIIEAVELSQQDACIWIRDKIESEGTSKVVCEDFIISNRTAKMKTSDTRHSLEIIGMIRYFCLLNKTPLILQTPVHMKKFFSGWSLKDFGLWVKGGAGHKRDALRHGVVYLLSTNRWDPQDVSASKGDYSILKEQIENGRY